MPDRRPRRGSGQLRRGRAGWGGASVPSARARRAREVGMKATQGRLCQLDPQDLQLLPGGGGRGKGRGTHRVGLVACLLQLSECLL